MIGAEKKLEMEREAIVKDPDLCRAAIMKCQATDELTSRVVDIFVWSYRALTLSAEMFL